MDRLTWVRSWPEIVPPGRAYVADGLDKLVMRDHDYSTAKGWPDVEPGVCLLEWDVALGLRERSRFEEAALVEPDRVLVAPYDILPEGRGPTVVHKLCPDPTKLGMRWPITPGDVEAHSFGFGCIYLPRAVLNAWPPGKVMRDNTFSDWHIANYGTARVTWAVHPQHLHGD